MDATLREHVYIEHPAEYPPVAKGLVLKLNQALDWLKLSQREWKITLNKFLREDLKMTQLKTEKCIYVPFNYDKSEFIILAVSAE